MSRPNSWDVYRWPEFQAFARRLGIPLDETFTRSLTIRMESPDHEVQITHGYPGVDKKESADAPEVVWEKDPTEPVIDTTTFRNEGWRTGTPRKLPDVG